MELLETLIAKLEAAQNSQNLHSIVHFSLHKKKRDSCLLGCVCSDHIRSNLKVTDHDGMRHVGFIMGKAKLAPQTVLTVPRLERCEAVLAVVIEEKIYYSYIATLLINHYHEKVNHQGRIFTEGAIRTGGFWIVGAKGRINKHPLQVHHLLQTER